MAGRARQRREEESSFWHLSKSLRRPSIFYGFSRS
jgi:hypothetical protein